jgi:hypothetical protein
MKVLSMRVVPLGGSVDDIDAYLGPDFDHLDDKLTESFLDYLDERQINDNLGYQICTLAIAHEQQIYTHWLKSARDFVIAK